MTFKRCWSIIKLCLLLIIQTSSKPGCRLLCPYKKVVILIEETTEQREAKLRANKIRESSSLKADMSPVQPFLWWAVVQSFLWNGKQALCCLVSPYLLSLIWDEDGFSRHPDQRKLRWRETAKQKGYFWSVALSFLPLFFQLSRGIQQNWLCLG